MTWQDCAKQLGFGQSRKVECCSDDRSAYISNSVAGVRFGPCLRCGRQEFEPHRGLSAIEIMRMRKRSDDLRGLSALPRDLVRSSFPPAVVVWLSKAGLHLNTAERWGIGYSKFYDRVFLPLYDDGRDTGAFIARSLNGGAKYINSKHARDHHWVNGESEVGVVVEDILSAIKVHAAGYRVGAILGTAPSPQLLEKVTRGTSCVVGWLDPDAGGDKGWRALRKCMAMFDQPLVRVRSEKDPKMHTVQEIQTYIGDAIDRPNHPPHSEIQGGLP